MFRHRGGEKGLGFTRNTGHMSSHPLNSRTPLDRGGFRL